MLFVLGSLVWSQALFPWTRTKKRSPTESTSIECVPSELRFRPEGRKKTLSPFSKISDLTGLGGVFVRAFLMAGGR